MRGQIECATCGESTALEDAEHVGVLDDTQECGWRASVDGEAAFLCPTCYEEADK